MDLLKGGVFCRSSRLILFQKTLPPKTMRRSVLNLLDWIDKSLPVLKDLTAQGTLEPCATGCSEPLPASGGPPQKQRPDPTICSRRFTSRSQSTSFLVTMQYVKSTVAADRGRR